MIALGAVTMALTAGSAHAAPVAFWTGDGGDVVAPGAVTILTPHPLWGDVSDDAGLAPGTAKWVSYANTGIGGSVAPNAASRTRGSETMLLSRNFVFTAPTALKLWILTDDTAAVDLVGPGPVTQVLFNPFPGQIDPCAPGGTGVPIGCVERDMGVASLLVGPGSYTLNVYSFQTNHDVFGTQYAGTYDVVPEPGSMVLLGTGLLGLASGARRRWLRK
jgi:hypothetical protein